MGTIEKAYTKNIVADICDEIERQWEHHLLIRAAFPAGIPDDRSQYKSPPYYRRKNVVFLVCRPQPLPAVMARGYDGVGAWANQNYVIRLFGILEEYGVIKAGKNAILTPKSLHYFAIRLVLTQEARRIQDDLRLRGLQG